MLAWMAIIINLVILKAFKMLVCVSTSLLSLSYILRKEGSIVEDTNEGKGF